PVPSGDMSEPTVFGLPNPDTPTNLMYERRRLETVIPISATLADLDICSAPKFLNSIAGAAYTMRPVRFEYDTVGGHLNGLLAPPTTSTGDSNTVVGAGVAPGTQLMEVTVSAPIVEDDAVGRGKLENGTSVAFVAPAETALQAVNTSEKPP